MGENPGSQEDGLWKGHFHWRVLLRWDVLAWTSGTLLAVAGILLAVDQSEWANVCFTATAMFILAKVAQLAITSADSPWQRMLFTFVIFGLVGIALVETVRGVNSWKRSHEAPPKADAAPVMPTLDVEAYIQPGSLKPISSANGHWWNYLGRQLCRCSA